MFRAILSPNLIPVSLESSNLNPRPKVVLLICTPLFSFVHSQPQIEVPLISNSATLSIYFRTHCFSVNLLIAEYLLLTSLGSTAT
jgi:hypothetical protein